MDVTQLYPPIESILPHRDSMLLLDRVLACTEETLLAEYRVQGDGWYANAEAAMPAWIGIELMAQAVAAHVSLLAIRAGGQARPGVLLGTNKYQAHRAAFPGAALLQISARELLRSDEGHSAYDCTIAYDGACVAQAAIKVFQPTNFEEFMSGSPQK